MFEYTLYEWIGLDGVRYRIDAESIGTPEERAQFTVKYMRNKPGCYGEEWHELSIPELHCWQYEIILELVSLVKENRQLLQQSCIED
jgi:hypothetical protein